MSTEARKPLEARRFFEKLKKFMGNGNRIELLLSSEDPELGLYLSHSGATGSTHMAEDGTICIKIHDAGSATRGCLLEECAHALQFVRDGNLPLSVDSQERDRRESEVASCLLARRDLDPEDRKHYEEAASAFGGER